MNILEGAVVDVLVSSVEQFGIVVECEGRKGLILETNIWWDLDDAHKRMLEAFEPGQKLRAKVLLISQDHFSASIKHLHPEQDPWWNPSIYSEGTSHRGTVKLIFDLGGALVKLENGAQVFVEKLKSNTRLHDPVSIVVRSVDVEKQKIEAEQV